MNDNVRGGAKRLASGVLSLVVVMLLLSGLVLGGNGLLPARWLLQPAWATRLSPELTSLAQSAIPGATVRLDGSLSTGAGDLYVPLLPPPKFGKVSKPEIELQTHGVILYSNGWTHMKVTRKGAAKTLVMPADLAEKYKKRIMTSKFPSDFIVPEGFVLPKSWKPLAGEVAITFLDDAVIAAPDFGVKAEPVERTSYKGAGSVFLTSITSGSITMLDGKTLSKIAEFPTEGTPCSMELANGQLYIADQAKNRVLVLDPYKRKFLGQIDLAPKSAPKGIVALPTGKWLYVSESAAGNIAIIETATGKVLLKTKVKPGPGRMAITPDGVFLLVLNVTSGEVSIISTYNQKVVSVIKVGNMPSSVAITSDGKLAYVTNRNSNTVSVIDVKQRQVAGTIKVGTAPGGIALSPDNLKLYVSCGRDNTITAYDTASLAKLNEVHLPREVEFPGALCMLPGGHQLLVASQQSGNIGIVDVDKMAFQKPTALGHPTNEIVWEPVP